MKIKTIALIPAAGVGSRMQSSTHKAFLELNNKPLLWHCLDQLSQADEISEIVIALHKNDFCYWESDKDLVQGRQCWKPIITVEGGETRAHSVFNAFVKAQELCDEEFYACVHDAARPYTGVSLIRAVIQAAEHTGAAGCALEVVDTIKRQFSDGHLETLPRSELRALQTPQVILSTIFAEGFSKWHQKGCYDVTDDFQIIEKGNVKVTLLPGRVENKKITFRGDI